jgi:hypothetical protein
VHLPTRAFSTSPPFTTNKLMPFTFSPFIIANEQYHQKMTTTNRPQTCNSLIFPSKWPLTKRPIHKFSFTNLAHNIKLNLLVHKNWSKRNANSSHFSKFYLNLEISIDSLLEDFVTKLKVGEATLSTKENSNEARTWDFKVFIARLERMYIIIGGWISLFPISFSNFLQVGSKKYKGCLNPFKNLNISGS